MYSVTLEDVPAGYESQYRATIEEKLAADCCVEFWQLDDSAPATEMSSREHENAMIVDLCHEAGDTGSEAELIEAFRSNHHADDIAAAASGDVAALVALRQACGLPVVS